MKTVLKAAFTVATLIYSLNTTHAADLFSTDRDASGWGFNVGLGPGFAFFSPDNNQLDQIVANVYSGIHGSAEVCKHTVGTAEWLDLCAGATGFFSLGESSSDISATLQGTSKMRSFGGYLKARAHAGAFMLAPYAGIRRITVDVDLTDSITNQTFSDSGSATAIFGGAEVGVKLWDDRLTLAVQGEAGKAVGGTDGSYAAIMPVLRYHF